MARRYVADHPLAMCLDIDLVRGLLGRWADDPTAAGLAARRVALAMAHAHLAAGHDVVVPQLVARPDFLEQLEALAAKLGLGFVELVLLDDKPTTVARFLSRSVAATDPAHADAGLLVDRSGGIPRVEALYDEVVALAASRPHAQVLPVHDGDPHRTYAGLLAALR
jgi:hypothetical protein